MKTSLLCALVFAGAALAGTAKADQYFNVGCASYNYNYAECNVNGPYARITSLQVIRQDSPYPCYSGRTFGVTNDGARIWVAGGCAAVFQVGLYGGYPPPPPPPPPTQIYTIDCDSSGSKYNSCGLNVDGYIVDARLVQQRSDSSCDEGRSWGYGSNYVWVDRGCRGRFEVYVQRRYR